MSEVFIFVIPLVIYGIAAYYRESGMEKIADIPTDDVSVLEHRLKIAKKNLTNAEKGRSLISGLMWIMLLSTIYFVGGPEQFGYDSVLGQFGFPFSIMTLALLGLYRFMMDDFPEKAKFEQIEKLTRDKKSEESRRAEREKEATEKAEYKAEQIEKAMNLKKEGGIENLEKALEILKYYE